VDETMAKRDDVWISERVEESRGSEMHDSEGTLAARAHLSDLTASSY
jgi:hypothetical protein